MSDLTPRIPERPLIWSDFVYDLQDMMTDVDLPVYIVGGAVRDAYLHRPVKDLDLLTPLHSIKLAKQIADLYQGDVYVMDKERGVARALVETPTGKIIMDIAQFRGESLLDDLLDRDFTINAMVVDLFGDLNQIIDPLNGQEDASKKILRRCSPDSLSNDPIRTLRGVRQSSQLSLRIEPETLSDIRQQAERLATVSPERVRDEFFNLLSLPSPSIALRIAAKVGLLKEIIPATTILDEGGWAQTLSIIDKLSRILAAISPRRTDNSAAVFDLGMMIIQLDRYRGQLQEYLATAWANDRPHQSLLMLAALLHDLPSSDKDMSIVEQYGGSLRLSNAEKQHLVSIINHYRFPLETENLTNLDLHRFWYPAGAAGVDACLLALAHYLGVSGVDLNQDGWLMLVDRVRMLLEAYYDHHDTLVKPKLLLDGNQLIQEFDLKSGPVVGQLLTMIREGQVTGSIQEIDDARRLVSQYLAG